MVLALAVLLAVLGSVVVAVTLPVSVTVPVAVGVTVIFTVTVAALAMVPTVQVRVGAVNVHGPWLAVAPTKFSPAGKLSVTMTPAACAGPLFLTVTV